MDTYIDALLHIVFSLFAGLIAWKVVGTKNKKNLILSLIAALIAGVGIDIDHFIDYFLAYGFTFNYQDFIHGANFFSTGKTYILFHGFEYAAFAGILSILTKNKKAKTIFLALSLGMLFHLLVDIFLLAIPFKIYFILYRLINNFNIQMPFHK